MVLENDRDPDGDPVWVLRSSDPSTGATHNDGTAVTYTPEAGYRGLARFTYTISDPRNALSTGRVEIAVGDTNLPPVAVDDTAHVDAGDSVAVDVLANDNDADGEALHLRTVEAPQSGATRIEGGRVRYTASASFHGEVAFAYTVADTTGATGQATVHIQVDAGSQPEPPAPPSVPPTTPTPRPAPTPPAPPTPTPAPPPPPAPSPGTPNSAPAFTAGPNQTVLEDAGIQSVPGWATGISPGPPADNGQTVTFQTTDTNAALFTVGGRPSVAADGTLTFTPAADANGAATVTLTAVDDGGTQNGGIDSSVPQTFTITVSPVNDKPAFTPGADQNVSEDAGPQTVPGWATAISPGPADETGQSLLFAVMNSNNLLFTTGGQPAVATDGSLSFTPAANASGTATVTVQAVDNGGTTNGGSDTSTPQTLTIQVTAQPDPPQAADETVSVNEDDPAGVSFDVLANDSDPDGDALSVTATDATAIAAGQLTQNGGGNFTYIPGPGILRHRDVRLHRLRRQRRNGNRRRHDQHPPTARRSDRRRRRVHHRTGDATDRCRTGTPRQRLRRRRRPTHRQHLAAELPCERTRPRSRKRFLRLHTQPALHRHRQLHLPGRRRNRAQRNRPRHDHRQLDHRILDAVPAAHRSLRRPVGHHRHHSPERCACPRPRRRRRPRAHDQAWRRQRVDYRRQQIPDLAIRPAGTATARRARDAEAVEHRRGLRHR